MEYRGLVSEIRSSIDYARDFLKESPKPSRKEAIDMLEDVLDDVEWCINNLVKDEDIAILKEIDTFWQGVFNANDRVSKWKQTIQNTIRNLEKRD
jgi:predicted phage-related endonuclease